MYLDILLINCVRYACAIPNPDNEAEVIVTGGRDNATRVSVYSEAGWQRDMPSLNSNREWHACSSFQYLDITVV